MTENEMWTAYIARFPEKSNATYDAWCYGSDDPDQLAALTLCGKKTATASAYPFYPFEGSPLPMVGQLNLILRTDGTAACITQNTHVNVVPFCEVTAEHAFKEGEGDRTLAFWRRVHEQVFTMELREIQAEFSQDMLVVCEEFSVVFP